MDGKVQSLWYLRAVASFINPGSQGNRMTNRAAEQFSRGGTQRRWGSLGVLLSLGLLGACDLPDHTGPSRVRVFTPGEDGAYGFHDEVLTTLESAREVRGASILMRGGGSVLLEAAVLEGTLTAETEAALRETTLVKGDVSVEAEYRVEDGVLVPTDWDSLVMFSFYRGVEQGREYFSELGVPEDALRQTTCYFKLNLTSAFAFGAPLVTDNAGFSPIADSFFLFPNQVLNEGLPLALNVGVTVHELSHAVKHRMIHGEDRLPLSLDGWGDEAMHTDASIDEGLADFFAAHYTGDPNFIAESIDESFELERDISVETRFTADLHEQAMADELMYDPYPLGTALASWLWAIPASDTERSELAVAVVTTLAGLRPHLGPDYRLVEFLELVVLNLEGALKERACELLRVRLDSSFGEVPACGI